MYTDVPKPTGTSYTNVSKGGLINYDDSSLAYDDPNTYYDGINPSLYTNVAKPVATSYTNIPKPT